MFQGRYGNDFLNRALVFTALGVSLLNLLQGIFFGSGHLVSRLMSIITLALLVIAFVRMFSKNFEARRRENEKFFLFWNRFRSRFGNVSWNGKGQPRAKTAKANPTWEERRRYKYLICPQCAQRLRVPRGKGKIRVTCTRCSNKFEVKS